MSIKREWKPLLAITAVFLAVFYLPLESSRFSSSLIESLRLAKWYAREHVLLCLVPAFFIAGAIGVFVSSASVMKYLGAGANKFLAYTVASVSGSILAVCSCTILPLFAGIYKMGAGIGPASAFLYSGPAVNVLAIILTARVLRVEIGIARAVGAIVFAVIIGLLMHFFFRKEEKLKAAAQIAQPPVETKRPLWLEALFFFSMVGVLVFANWGKPSADAGLWHLVWSTKWLITAAFAIMFAVLMLRMFALKSWAVLIAAVPVIILGIVFPQHPGVAFIAGIIGLSVLLAVKGGEPGEWLASSWTFARQILPLLLFGVLIAGLLLGMPDSEGLIPSEWVAGLVGGNSLASNFYASFLGAFMYFATLTEVPILEGLIGSGMGKGPALALLLAGPALSLPNMLVIRSVMGTKKTVVFVSLVVIMATISGYLYGLFT